MKRDLQKELNDGNLCLGTWLSLGSSVIAEIAAECGFAWLLFDLEHGFGTEATLLPQLQAIRGANVSAIVRVGAPHPDLILRALDWGADGIMVPHVSNVTEAENVVRAMNYAPRGHRGFSRSARVYSYGLKPPGDAKDIKSPLFMAQIENIEGVENVHEIAAVDGVDVLFVGPADLQFDLNARPEKAVRSFQDCLERVASAAKKAGKTCGILIRNPEEISKYRELGFTCLAMDSDLAILRKGFQKLLENS